MNINDGLIIIHPDKLLAVLICLCFWFTGLDTSILPVKNFILRKAQTFSNITANLIVGLSIMLLSALVFYLFVLAH